MTPAATIILNVIPTNTVKDSNTATRTNVMGVLSSWRIERIIGIQHAREMTRSREVKLKMKMVLD